MSVAFEPARDLKWETFAQTRGGRDLLYVARDLSVDALAVDRVRNADTRRDIAFSSDQLSDNRDLPQLLVGAGKHLVPPKRAVAFEQLGPALAIARHPELVPLYEHMPRADVEAHRNFGDNAETRDRFLTSVRSRLQATLDAGELRVQAVAKSQPERPKAAEPER